MFFEKLLQCIKSNFKCLFEIIQSFAKTTYYSKKLEISVFEKYFYINFFIHIIIKKNDFNIHLLNISIIDDDYNENDFITHKLNYRNENLVIIKIFQLFKIFHTSTNFVTSNFFIDAFFALINSFVDKNFAIF